MCYKWPSHENDTQLDIDEHGIYANVYHDNIDHILNNVFGNTFHIALLALCEENPSFAGGFLSERPSNAGIW